MLSRRDLIATVPAAVMGFAPMAAAAPLAGPSDDAAVAALAAAAYPHPRLGGAFYAQVAARYLAALDPAGRAAIMGFIATLGIAVKGDWATAPLDRRIAVLKAHAGAPVFAGFLWQMAEFVYRDPKVWALIGFEGSSIEQGGYIQRGFDDIDWLPA